MRGSILVHTSNPIQFLKLLSLQLYDLKYQINKIYRVSRAARIRPTTKKIWLNWEVWTASHYLEIVWNVIRWIHQLQEFDMYLCRQTQFIRIYREILNTHLLAELKND